MDNYDSEETVVIVRCNHCEFMTTDEEIQACPNCGRDDCLFDMTAETIALQNNRRHGYADTG